MEIKYSNCFFFSPTTSSARESSISDLSHFNSIVDYLGLRRVGEEVEEKTRSTGST